MELIPQFNNAVYIYIYQYALYIILLYILPLAILTWICTQLTYAIIYWNRKQKEIIRLSHNDRTNPLELKSFVADYFDRRGTNAEGNNGTFVLVVIIVVFILFEATELVHKFMAMLFRLSGD